MNLQLAVQQANAEYPGGCPACKGVRFKTCKACGEKPNSFHDDYHGIPRGQTYDTTRDWREVNGSPMPNVPDKNLQP